MRLLLVEDDPMIGASVQRGLKQDGHTVDWARDGDSATLALIGAEYELILLDLGLPKKDGLTLLADWRRKGVSLPVLVITARDSIADRVRGLDAGADDYLVKPFDLDELSARVRALMRRRNGRATPAIEIGGLSLDPAAHAVTLDSEPVTLSRREFSLLHALMKQPGVPMSRARIEESLYGWGEEIESNAIEVHIHSLRRKLGAERIRNVRGVGYMVPDEP
ncbi:MAG: response regulator [Candidatus Accumulibacter sp.]|jgi:two-component system response regulator QseB|nr:response regulator [Accumulibacter sp.]